MDWQKLITDLLAAGWTQEQIARELGKPNGQSWVSELGRGLYKDILWHTGERLRKLHARVMRRQRKQRQKGES